MIIIGHCPDQHFKSNLIGIVKSSSNITLITNQEPVPYQQIQEQITKADLAIVSYEINESNVNCIPTKVFEYLAMGLPFICEKESNWFKISSPTKMAFGTDLNSPDIIKMLKWHKNLDYNYNQSEYTWSSDSEKLNLFVSEILL